MKKNNKLVVLFNYGGGMRGIIPAMIMARIEHVTGLRMSDMVDVFTGPSTGAILNTALNVPSKRNPKRPKYRARHMVSFYKREGLNIFPPDRFRDFRGFIHDFNQRTMKIGKLKSLFKHGHYDPSYLSKCLKDLYGDADLNQALCNIVVPVYNIDGDQLPLALEGDDNEDMPVHTKNNFTDGGGHAIWLKHMQDGMVRKHSSDVSMRDAVLASCAAPTYFPCHHFVANGVNYSGIDGSIFDNPCVSYHGALSQHIPDETDVIMILLGTGLTVRSFKKEDWNRFGGLGVVDPMNDLPLINILFQATESALIESFSQELGDNLFIFNKSLLQDLEELDMPEEAIDDASSQNLKKLEHFAEQIMDENSEQLDRLCDLLVQNHNRKTQDATLWSRVFGT